MEKENYNSMLEPKPLCFTTSYNRPYYLYNIINNILNQSYKNIIYSVNINIDNDHEKPFYLDLLKDFADDSRLKIFFSSPMSQHINYITALTKNINNHNIFIKIDDDDIYHKNYIDNAIKLYTDTKADIVSFVSSIHINNNKFGRR